MKIIIITLIFILTANTSHAIKILTVKGARVLIDLEGESLQTDDKLGARDEEGRAKALLEVKQVKGTRAIAQVTKGQIKPTYSLAKMNSTARGAGAHSGRSSWGLMAGYAKNSMSIKIGSTSTISLSGTSYDLSGFYQLPIDGNFSARLLGGYETLTASGKSSNTDCQNTTNCTVDISYLGLEALVRYTFLPTTSIDYWGGAGLGFLYAIGKTSSILDTSKISTNQTIVFSLGLDYKMSPSSFIPVQLDYAMYPDNSTTSANQIILRFGYGMGF